MVVCALVVGLMAEPGPGGAGDSPNAAPRAAQLSPYPAATPLLPVVFEGASNPDGAFISRTRTASILVDPASLRVLEPQTGAASLGIQFVTTSASARAVGRDAVATKTSYFGAGGSGTRVGVANFGGVGVDDAYDGIHLRYRDSGTKETPTGDLEFDAIVDPGADPSAVTVRPTGASAVSLENGSLVVEGADGRLGLSPPKSYQLGDDGGRTEIASRWSRRGEVEFGFELAAYDRSRTLVIDPAVTYSTYSGGSGEDTGTSVAIGPDGSIFVAGTTASTNFPTTAPIQGANAGLHDVFITKIAPSGRTRVWSTYLGGSGNDRVSGVAIDSGGAAVVTGFTDSTNFPTALAVQGANAGGTDGFVTKINAFGTGLDYSTYLGGSGDDRPGTTAVDITGNAVVGGWSDSTNFPTTGGALQTSTGGGRDGFVTKMSPDGSSRVFSTYLGGSLTDSVASVAVAPNGEIGVGGSTSSANFPVASAIQPASGGASDAFVTRLNASGSAAVYSTYLGGAGSDSAAAVRFDITGDALVAGTTLSSDFPTAFPLQPSPGGVTGTSDAFVAKFDPAGSSKLYATYLGGSGDDSASGLAVAADGRAVIAGTTSSDDAPTAAPNQAARGGGDDAYFAELSVAGDTLDFGTYDGGSATDQAAAIAVDPSFDIFVAVGRTTSTDMPTTNAIQGAAAGGDETFVIGMANLVPISGTVTNGANGAVSAYRANGGALAAYLPISTDNYSIMVPTNNKNCPNNGYKILFTAPAGFESHWYLDQQNFADATCVSAPASGVDQILPPASVISGYVKDAQTAADIDGAVIYVYRASDGKYVDYTVTGGGQGPGRFAIPMVTGIQYKILVQPPAGYDRQWYSGVQSWTPATSTASPATVNFSVQPSANLTGYARHQPNNKPIDDARVYAYSASTGAFVGQAKTGVVESGRYDMRLSAATTYKLLIASPDGYEDIWWDGAPGYAEATAVAAPGTANFTLRDGKLIWGHVTHLGSPQANAYVSAYTTCGCTSPTNAVTDANGYYQIKVATTSASGWQYKVRFLPPAGQSRWYLDSTGFAGATAVNSPSSNVDQTIPP